LYPKSLFDTNVEHSSLLVGFFLVVLKYPLIKCSEIEQPKGIQP
jgi:hypothetical protein